MTQTTLLRRLHTATLRNQSTHPMKEWRGWGRKKETQYRWKVSFSKAFVQQSQRLILGKIQGEHVKYISVLTSTFLQRTVLWRSIGILVPLLFPITIQHNSVPDTKRQTVLKPYACIARGDKLCAVSLFSTESRLDLRLSKFVNSLDVRKKQMANRLDPNRGILSHVHLLVILSGSQLFNYGNNDATFFHLNWGKLELTMDGFEFHYWPMSSIPLQNTTPYVQNEFKDTLGIDSKHPRKLERMEENNFTGLLSD